MANKSLRFDFIISAAEKGVKSTFDAVVSGADRSVRGVNVFNKSLQNGGAAIAKIRAQLIGLAGAYAGVGALTQIKDIMQGAEQASFNLEASMRAANREFANVGSMQSWTRTVGELRQELQVYSESAIKNAVSRTVDMTKRLGLSEDQMKRVISLTADLSAGKTDLEGGIERVTAALRGEAEASEYLGLTLNENYVKAWHEANGQHEKAWKDLTDLEKAQVRYNVFLEQAIPMQGRAAESAKTFGGAMAEMRGEIEKNIMNSPDVVSAMKAVADVMRENSGEIASMVGSLVTMIAKFIEWSVENREVLATLLKYGAVAIVFKTLFDFAAFGVKIWNSLNLAFVTMTGSQLIPWLLSVRSGLSFANIAAMGLKGTIGALAGLLGAFAVGWQFGEWLTGFDSVRTVAQATIATIIIGLKRLQAAYYETKIAAKSIYGGDTSEDQRKLAAVEREIQMHRQLRAEIWQNGTEQKEYAKSAADAHKSAADAAEDSAARQEKIQRDTIARLRQEYKEYKDQVLKYRQEIAGKEQSLAEELRAMSRDGMSEIKSWQDRKKEAEEFFEAAQAARQEGQAALAKNDKTAAEDAFKQAAELANKAKTAFRDLKGEVKEGDQVLISQADSLKLAMEGVEKAGRLAIDIIGDQKAHAQKLADEVDSKIGEALGVVNQTAEATAGLRQEIVKAGDTWVQAWRAAGDKSEQVMDGLGRTLDELAKDRTIKIDVKLTSKAQSILDSFKGSGLDVNVPGYRYGGAIGMNTGGGLPGYGGGDKIRALLEAGEFVIRKEAVRKYGLGLFASLNSMRLNIGQVVRARVGGLISNFKMPQLPPLRFATGGMVPAAAGGSGEVVRIDLNLPTSGPAISLQGTRSATNELLRQLAEMRRFNS